jgi:hypothetical protein
LHKEFAFAVEEKHMDRSVTQLSCMNVRTRRRADDPVVVVNDIKDFLAHDAWMKAQPVWHGPDKKKAPRDCGGPSVVAYPVGKIRTSH